MWIYNAGVLKPSLAHRQLKRPPSATSKSIGSRHLCTTASAGKSLLSCLLRTAMKLLDYILTLLHYQLGVYEPNVLALGRVPGKNSYRGGLIFWILYIYVFWSLPLQAGEWAFFSAVATPYDAGRLLSYLSHEENGSSGLCSHGVWSTPTAHLAEPQLTHRWPRPRHATARGATAIHQSPPWKVLSCSTEKLTQQQNKYELILAWIEINQG